MKIQKNNETLILISGATLITLGVCYWFYLSPIFRNFFQLKKEIQELETRLTNQPQELEATQSEKQQLHQQMERFEKEMLLADAEAKKLLHSFQTVDPMETVVEVSKLFKKNNILLMESSFIDSVQPIPSSEDPKIQELLKKPDLVNHYEHQANPERKRAEHFFLKLDFMASFLDVSRLMKELSQLEIRIFPLGLRMEKMEGERNVHRWYMVLWL